MNITFVSRSASAKIPKKFLSTWVKQVCKKLVQHKILSPAQKKLLKSEPELVLVFVSASQMKKLNGQFRGRDYATDVLSFGPHMAGVSASRGFDDDLALGELVLCVPVIKKQAVEHELKYEEELGYMVLHGILHLLGFDHEKTRVEEKRMFKVQDDVFAELRKKI